MSGFPGIRKEVLKKVRRVVVKVGTSLLTGADGRLSQTAVTRLVGQIAEVRRRGLEVVLVSSGAIAAGMAELGIAQRPKKIPLLQAAAAVGQSVLMKEYFHAFKATGLSCAQILLTNEDLKSRSRYLNIRNTFLTLLGQGVIPVVNENDTVGTQEIRFGDNDRLSALVTQLVAAQLLLLLSDVDGLLRSDARGSKVRVGLVEAGDQNVDSYVWGGSSRLGTGGMKSKLVAARMVTRAGEVAVIADGRNEDVLPKIISGENIGTMFLPKSGKMAGKKRWIAHFVVPRGKVIVDDGARRALLDGKKSLLSSGVREVMGDFKQGDTLGICGLDGEDFARGILAYASGELSGIAGKKSGEIFNILGRKTPAEVIHRDNLVIL